LRRAATRGGARGRAASRTRAASGASAGSRTGRARDAAPASAPAPPLRFPAEWEPHRATWIAWPHHEPDWPSKLAPIPWVYAEIARVLAESELVEVLCHDARVREDARRKLAAHGVPKQRVRLHLVPTDRVWLRDSAPSFVRDARGAVALASWRFNAWAKYRNYRRDARVGAAIERITGLPRVLPCRPDRSDAPLRSAAEGAREAQRVVLEGGSIDANGAGRLLTTEECLLSKVQERNPGLDRAGYERVFAAALGIRETIWLGEGCVGDDTHGHVDDVARFVDRDAVVLAYEADPADENHARSRDNAERLARVPGLRVVRLPFPRPVWMNGVRLPASYANFYVANRAVLVPTFNDPNDRVALNTLAEVFPGRAVVGIHAVDLVWGLGTLHCLTQQEPAANPFEV
jgi:agmatine deiminase